MAAQGTEVRASVAGQVLYHSSHARSVLGTVKAQKMLLQPQTSQSTTVPRLQADTWSPWGQHNSPHFLTAAHGTREPALLFGSSHSLFDFILTLFMVEK
jgi:hypothetical protein